MSNKFSFIGTFCDGIGERIIPDLLIQETIEQSLDIKGEIFLQFIPVGKTMICYCKIQVHQTIIIQFSKIPTNVLFSYPYEGTVNIYQRSSGKKIVSRTSDNVYNITYPNDQIELRFVKGKFEFFFILFNSYFAAPIYSSKTMHPKMCVYWVLLSKGLRYLDEKALEIILLPIQYYTKQSSVILEISSLSHYMTVYEVAKHIIIGYQNPTIVKEQLKKLRIERHLFYKVFNQLYGITPTMLCIYVRLYHGDLLKNTNPTMRTSKIAFEIGFSSVSNYLRTKQKYFL